MPELIDRMKENLLRFNRGDKTVFTQEEQYLFEHIQTPEDLYDFLDEHLGLDDWDQSEVFGFTLCLVSETGKAGGYDSEKPASDGYANAVANLTILEIGEIVKLGID